MGVMRHDVVVATTWVGPAQDGIQNFLGMMPPEFRGLVCGPTKGLVNGAYTYVFVPDGSKEGWDQSGQVDRYREAFIDLLKASGVEYVHVRFGGDESEFGPPTVEASSYERGEEFDLCGLKINPGPQGGRFA